MEARTIGVVVVRLFSLYLVILAARDLVAIWSYHPYFSQPGTAEFSISEIVGPFIPGVVVPCISAIIVWFFADHLVPRAGPGEQEESNTTPHDMMLVGASILGCYILLMGLVAMATVEHQIFVSHVYADSYGWDALSERLQRQKLRVPYIIQLTLGVAMILGRRRLSSLLVKAKQVGSDRAADRSA